MYYPSLNIGIEEEYQLIDPESRELVGYVTQSMSQDQLVVRERTPDVELAQPFGDAVIEVGMPVCADIKDARDALLRMRESILRVAHAHGYRVIGAGTPRPASVGFWAARSYRRRRSGASGGCDEHHALFIAPYSLSQHQFTFLDGTQYRA